MIRRWFRNFVERRRVRRFNAGYDFAAGALLRGDYTPDDIEALVRSPFNDDFDPFDNGAMEAAIVYRQLTNT